MVILRNAGLRKFRDVYASPRIRKCLAVRGDFRIGRDTALVPIEQVTTICRVHRRACLRCVHLHAALPGNEQIGDQTMQ